MMKDFKSFIKRGNVVDLAVGVVIGVAFGKIVNSFVEDLIMPPVGLVIGGVDFADLSIVLRRGTEEVEEVAIRYGQFINVALDFFLIALALFIVIKTFERFKKKEEEKEQKKPPVSPTEVELLKDIRDLLKESQSKNQ